MTAPLQRSTRHKRVAWTAEHQQRAEDLRAQVLSYQAIGEALGFSHSMIIYRLEPAAAEKNREACRRYQASKPKAEPKPRRPRRGWGEEDQRRSEELRAQGATYHAIGDALGRDGSTIRRRLIPKAAESMRERIRRWRGENPESAREACRHWRNANPEKARANSTRWHRENPSKARDNNRRRKSLIRAGRKASLVPLTLQQKGERFAMFGDRCAYCGSRPKAPLTVDHVLALSKGGLDEAANVIPACGRCNKSKNDSPVEAWFRRQPFFTEARWKLIRRHAPAAAGGQPSLALAAATAQQGGRP